ncbi:hypothetical protein [Candidatus Venteria ishoeyi]|uniref:Uncharacterized protein n=1 Tax=Candidatus Venteria ishoeyi TaxID=1899563 RepID=A0A1H6F9R0_9GAMM|nr:hypothetical protein [Candidatus Venteria ishoeyi]SEH06049.1 Uncharacterised protein [Candidatus Venteria ishoeyi]
MSLFKIFFSLTLFNLIFFQGFSSPAQAQSCSENWQQVNPVGELK